MDIYSIRVKNIPLLARKEEGRWVAAFKNPAVFASKKKAKRILKRLNKHHGGNWALLKY